MLRKSAFLIFSILMAFIACEDKVEPKFELLFEPSELKFGRIETNQTVSQKIRIKNTDNSTGAFTGAVEIVDSSGFSMDFKGVLTLQKNETKEIYITFRPLSVSEYSGKIVASNDHSFSEMYMYGEGAAPVSFSYSPNALEFGLVKEGEYKDLDLTIMNSASSGFDLEITYSIPSGEFSIVDGVSSYVIVPGKSAVIPIRYSPASATATKKITINHNSSAQTNPITVVLSGIMERTTEINTLISEGWATFENGDYSGSSLKFQQAINLASQHESYDSLQSEAMVGRGWAFTFERKYSSGHNDFSSTLNKFDNLISGDACLDALAGKTITGRLINNYSSSIEAAIDLLDRNSKYQFSHKASVDFKDVRMALIQSYFNTGEFIKSAAEMDILDPANAPHSSDPATLLAAIQALSGSL